MKIIILASIQFTPKIKELKERLEKEGHIIEIPITSKKIINWELTLEEFYKENNSWEWDKRKINDNVIKKFYEKIKKCDAVLVLNITKNDIENYIGWNTFLEMWFAYVLNKKIFLFNDIPNMHYSDEIKAMLPIVINWDLSKVK